MWLFRLPVRLVEWARDGTWSGAPSAVEVYSNLLLLGYKFSVVSWHESLDCVAAILLLRIKCFVLLRPCTLRVGWAKKFERSALWSAKLNACRICGFVSVTSFEAS